MVILSKYGTQSVLESECLAKRGNDEPHHLQQPPRNHLNGLKNAYWRRRTVPKYGVAKPNWHPVMMDSADRPIDSGGLPPACRRSSNCSNNSDNTPRNHCLGLSVAEEIRWREIGKKKRKQNKTERGAEGGIPVRSTEYAVSVSFPLSRLPSARTKKPSERGSDLPVPPLLCYYSTKSATTHSQIIQTTPETFCCTKVPRRGSDWSDVGAWGVALQRLCIGNSMRPFHATPYLG